MPPQQQQQQLYDSVTDNYEQAGNYQQAGPNNAGNAQNFGNPYDCPEGMYGGSMVSSVGYSKVIHFIRTHGRCIMPYSLIPS